MGMFVGKCVFVYRSRCHGNVHLNDDSHSQRSILIALHVILNTIDIRCTQNACDNKSHARRLQAECT